mmetsp:Transcript_1327/g.4175  ORF Transcript_1327/g.4175 Transcript_1327/m.4175 type:complete len:223 (+) Transcript_1327:504-1172(+)
MSQHRYTSRTRTSCRAHAWMALARSLLRLTTSSCALRARTCSTGRGELTPLRSTTRQSCGRMRSWTASLVLHMHGVQYYFLKRWFLFLAMARGCAQHWTWKVTQRCGASFAERAWLGASSSWRTALGECASYVRPPTSGSKKGTLRSVLSARRGACRRMALLSGACAARHLGPLESIFSASTSTHKAVHLCFMTRPGQGYPTCSVLHRVTPIPRLPLSKVKW